MENRNNELYCCTVRPFETDLWDAASPSLLVKLNMDAIVEKTTREGLGRARLQEKLNAVWMLARIRLFQNRPILSGEEMTISVSGRYSDLAMLRRQCEWRIGGELVGGADFAFIIVEEQSRTILRVSQAEPFWLVPPEAEKPEPFRRLRTIPAEGTPQSYEVRLSQCDSNRHLCSSGYADIVCDTTGHWERKHQFAKEMQLDFLAECPPKRCLSVFTQCGDDTAECLGLRDDGTRSFAAKFVYTPVDTARIMEG